MFIKNWRSILKSYSFMSIVASSLAIVSTMGLTYVGQLDKDVGMVSALALAMLFNIVGGVGRFINQDLSDGKVDMFGEEGV